MGVLEAVFPFETGGGPAIWRNIGGTSGPNCSLVSTPAPPRPNHETYCLKCVPNIKDNRWVTKTLTQSGNQAIGFAIQFSDVTPLANFDQDIIICKSDQIDWRIRMRGIGPNPGDYVFLLVESDGTETVIATNIFSANNWIVLDFTWTQGTSNAMLIHINGIFQYSLSGKNLKAGAGGDFTIDIGNGPVGPNIFFKNLYHMYNVSAFTDELHDITTRAYRISKDSTHADTDVNGSVSGATELANGVWKDVSDGATTGIRYDNLGDNGAVVCDSNVNGGVAGPAGDPLVHREATILGAVWMGEFSSGFTANQADILIGKKTKSGTHLVTAKDTEFLRTHRFEYFEETGTAGNRVPTTEDQILIGFGNKSASDNISARELWAVVVFQGDPSQAPTPTVHIKGGHIKSATIK